MSVFADAMRESVASGRAIADGAHKPGGDRGRDITSRLRGGAGGSGAGGGLSGMWRRLLSTWGMGGGGDEAAAAGERAPAAFARSHRRRGRYLMQSGRSEFLPDSYHIITIPFHVSTCLLASKSCNMHFEATDLACCMCLPDDNNGYNCA